MGGSLKLTDSQEDYLEVIFNLVVKNRVARNKDIAEKMNVKRASVTGAIKILVEKGFVEHENHGYILLSPKGEKLAKKLVDRHNLFHHFFRDILGIETIAAEDIACKIEHAVEGEALDKFRSLIENIDSCSYADSFSDM